jgi:hypothetical protein
MPAWERGAVAEDDRSAGDGVGVVERAVLEPFGEVQSHLPVAQIGDRTELSEARCRLRRSGYHISERPECCTPGCNRNSLQEPASIDRARSHIPSLLDAVLCGRT